MPTFIRNFGEIDILRTYGDNSIYTQYPIQPVQFNNSQLVYQVLVSTPGNYYFTLSQPDARNMGVKELSYCSMVLVKPPSDYNPNNKYQVLDPEAEKAKYIGGKAHHVRDVVMKVQLKKASYLFFVSKFKPRTIFNFFLGEHPRIQIIFKHDARKYQYLWKECSRDYIT